MHRRLRWENVARAAGAVALVVVAVAWPRLAPPQPALPEGGAAPLVRDGPEPAAPRARVREAAPPPGARAGQGRSSGRDVRRAAKGVDERAAPRDRRRPTRAAGGTAPGAGDKDGGAGRGGGRADRAPPTTGDEGAGGGRPTGDGAPGGVPPPEDDETGGGPPGGDDDAGGVPRAVADEDSDGATPDRDEPAPDPAAVEFGFEGG